MPPIKRLLTIAVLPAAFVFHFLVRVFWSGLNTRNVLTMPLNFMLNFAPVFTWLLIFKNAGLIPKDIRPRIHVALAYHVDTFMFSVAQSPLGCILTVALCFASAWLLWLRYYRETPSVLGKESYLSSSSLLDTELSVGVELAEWDLSPAPLHSAGDFQADSRIPALELVPVMAGSAAAANAAAINRRLAAHRRVHGNVPLNCWRAAPCVLVAALWFVLNIVHWFATPLLTPKDVVLWFSYVIGHFCVPLFTAIWLYVFHAPGALKLFSFALGSQNIAGVLTHLAFPNAPPWFITLNGEHGKASYDTPGYAAGLTRAPFATGTHLVDKGFHALPIVFGALPSLHLAMAVLCFFFVAHYSRWTIAKLALAAFVCVQWWATIYLDHHWRLDLIVGMMYAVVSFTLFRGRMAQAEAAFADARSRYDFAAGSTMGMRVFRNTRWQNFFDLLA